MYCASAFAFDFAGYLYLYMQRVMNAAARLVSGTRKFDRGLSQLLHVDLHWLDVADRAQFKLAMTVHRCLNNKAPHYLADSCMPVSSLVSGCDQPNVTVLTYHGTTALHLDVGHLLSPAPVFGTCCLTISEMPAMQKRPSNRCWRHSFWRSTSVFSALEILWRCAI